MLNLGGTRDKAKIVRWLNMVAHFVRLFRTCRAILQPVFVNNKEEKYSQ